MSKTIRRRSARYEYRWVLSDWAWIAPRYSVRQRIAPHSPEGRKRLAKFHSDSQRTMEMVPSYFRRSCNRKKRRENQQVLSRFSREGDWDHGPVMAPDKSKALSYWW